MKRYAALGLSPADFSFFNQTRRPPSVLPPTPFVHERERRGLTRGAWDRLERVQGDAPHRRMVELPADDDVKETTTKDVAGER